MLKHLLWTSLESWGQVTLELSSTEFSQLDADNLEAVVGQYARTALKIEKGLSPNQVEDWLLSGYGSHTYFCVSVNKKHIEDHTYAAAWTDTLGCRGRHYAV